MPRTIDKFRLRTALGAVFTTALIVSPDMIQAQVLEEIIVTAQRREQSLQEVPISIETMSGEEIQNQNFRNMEDLSTFSPSVFVQSGVQDQQVTVRGVGTIGNSLTLEQAVPIFVDGIHYGRQSQIKTAFLDVDRVEVLKGPQPVFFGQNASAGAFNIRSKNPTAEWEGDVNLLYGNNGDKELAFGVGGPINDTWGVRVAGAMEESDGFLKNAITGEKLPRYDYKGGRITLQWSPTDNFEATMKFEGSQLRNGSEAVLGCTTRGSAMYGRGNTTANPATVNAFGQGNERSVWLEPPRGTGLDYPHLPIADQCFEGDVAFSGEGPYLSPRDNIYEENSNSGAMDIRRAADGFASINGAGLGYDVGVGGADTNGIRGQDNADAATGVLNLVYTFANDVELTSTSAYNYYWRNAVKDNSDSPFLMNYQGREENYAQWSSELRFTSPVGGAFEWMAGVSIQESYKDNWSSSMRPTVRQGQRFNWLWEDVTLMNAFATLTFNFLDNRASIDVGGRYSSMDKDVFITGYGASWVFDVEPVSYANRRPIAAADAFIFVPSANTANLWYVPYTLGLSGNAANRRVPQEWWASNAQAVGLSRPDVQSRLTAETDDDGPIGDTFSDTFFDPQVTLRYRLNDDHSAFARWAKASKGAGYDTGQTSIPTSVDVMRFEAETGETFEIGSKGMFWDGRARYDATIFRTTFTDLQLSGLSQVSDQDGQTSIALNAGEQRVQGIELGVVAQITDEWQFGVNGAIMDGKMTEFAGSGCNLEETLHQQIINGVVPEPAGFSPNPDVLPCDLTPDGSGNPVELTDRSGTQAPRTPDWKFVVTSNYIMPMFDNYQLTFDVKGYYSDGYITARDTFASVVKYNTHGDVNVGVGFGDQDGVWKLSAYANNILEARESYNGELDFFPSGVNSTQVTRSNFMTYGLKFGYNFQ